MEYLIIHKKGKKERFEDAATAWYAVEDRYPGAVLSSRSGCGRGILTMHDLAEQGPIKVKAGRRIVAFVQRRC